MARPVASGPVRIDLRGWTTSLVSRQSDPIGNFGSITQTAAKSSAHKDSAPSLWSQARPPCVGAAVWLGSYLFGFWKYYIGTVDKRIGNRHNYRQLYGCIRYFHNEKHSCVSLLGRDGDHIRTDYGFAGRIFVFHPSRSTSIYRKHADALRCGVTRMTKSSLASTRPGSWSSPAPAGWVGKREAFAHARMRARFRVQKFVSA